MNELFEPLIERLTTPENAALLFQSVDLLQSAQSTEHVELIDDWVSYYDQMDSFMALNQVFQWLRDHLLTVIRANGVSLLEDTPLRVLNTILEAILALNTHGDVAYLLDAFRVEEDLDECCIELIARSSGLPWTLFAPYIVQCDRVALDIFKKRLQQRHRDGEPIENTEALNKQRARIKRFVIENKKPAYALVKEGARLNSDFHSLVQQHEETLHSLVDQPTEFAHKAIALLLISNLTLSEFDASFKALCDRYLSDLNQTTSAYRAFLQQLKKIAL